MTLVDTSIVVAAFASWHEQHSAADSEVDGKARLVAHCAIEALSVLTRLPPPHRVAGRMVRDFLAARFPDPYVGLDGAHYHALIPLLVELGVGGGAVYDALIARLCARRTTYWSAAIDGQRKPTSVSGSRSG